MKYRYPFRILLFIIFYYLRVVLKELNDTAVRWVCSKLNDRYPSRAGFPRIGHYREYAPEFSMVDLYLESFRKLENISEYVCIYLFTQVIMYMAA